MTLVLASEQHVFERYPLTDGTHILGTQADCDLRLEHPTVSRRHARIEVESGEARVIDLDSKNGTRIDDRVIRRSSRILSGQRLSFGTLDVLVESVAAGDLEPGVELMKSSPPTPRVDTTANEDVGTTAALGSLRDFALEHLPRILRHLDEASGRVRVAQAVGHALDSALPTRRVEILVEEDGNEAVLFASERAADARAGSDGVRSRRSGRRVERSDGQVAVRAEFLHRTQATSYEPILRVALRLLRLADRTPGPRLAIDPPSPVPALPEPATVVRAVRAIYDDAAKVALGDVSVMITGASGTGKEVLARYIHAASHRRRQPLVALNCAALPRDLLEAELFGVERGVATGVEARPGRFELADGGTLFLDEIADMAPETQAKILRILQEGEVYRIGARSARSADVRIVAATNGDVDALRDAGSFRLDLYHRIADWRVELPTLAARAADISNLAAHFLARAAERRGQAIAGISRSALQALERHQWPGNIRQLEREMARAALFVGPGELLQSTHLSAEIRNPPAAAGTSLRSRLAAAERTIVEQALSRSERLSDAARVLEISRSTLYRRLKALGIEAPDPRPAR